ncbi:MAG: septum site-determining protein MinC [Methylococcaceae bacterium]
MSVDSQKILEFKSSNFSVPVLVLFTAELTLIEQELLKKVQLAPDFFKDSPVVFDLQKLNEQGLDINIAEFITLLRQCTFLPVGIRGGNEAQNKQAISAFVPVYSANNSLTELAKTAINLPNKTEIITSTLITQPVRSGQRIYAQGDLIVLAQVSAGAEILAEGNIHIYGALRGRALAGVQGNNQARIFCLNLQAELISIAGNYKLSDDLQKTAVNQPVQIYLQDYALIIKEFI